MAKSQKIRDILAEIKSVRSELIEETERIKTDWSRSDSFKADAMAEAFEEAEAKLAEIGERAEAAVLDLESITAVQNAFDYSNPKLLAAVQFIQSNKTVPDAAWQQMISDFAKCPQELFYLSDLFSKNGATAAAIAAKEAAQEVAFSGGLPQRLSDKLYFVTHADPSAHIDLSGIEQDLAVLERAEANLREAPEE